MARRWTSAIAGLAFVSGCEPSRSDVEPAPTRLTSPTTRAATATAPVTATPPVTAVAATQPLPDVPQHGDPPTEWSGAEPLELRDEAESGCTGLRRDPWVRIECPGFTSGWLVTGHRVTQTRLVESAAGVSITTLYVPGTDLVVGLGGRRGATAIVRWTGPSRPARAAMILSHRARIHPTGDF